jgi:hypothetical protein
MTWETFLAKERELNKIWWFIRWSIVYWNYIVWVMDYDQDTLCEVIKSLFNTDGCLSIKVTSKNRISVTIRSLRAEHITEWIIDSLIANKEFYFDSMNHARHN